MLCRSSIGSMPSAAARFLRDHTPFLRRFMTRDSFRTTSFANDALYVINFLNNPNGEGEGSGESAAPSSVAGDMRVADGLAVVGLTTAVTDRVAVPLAPSTSVRQLPPADSWSTDVLEVGFATSSMPRDEEIWAASAEQWGLADLDELLSALLGPTTDEG